MSHSLQVRLFSVPYRLNVVSVHRLWCQIFIQRKHFLWNTIQITESGRPVNVWAAFLKLCSSLSLNIYIPMIVWQITTTTKLCRICRGYKRLVLDTLWVYKYKQNIIWGRGLKGQRGSHCRNIFPIFWSRQLLWWLYSFYLVNPWHRPILDRHNTAYELRNKCYSILFFYIIK
jgi:hypothetical protein